MSPLHCYTPNAPARLRLVCFPHAGGTADFYRDWAAALPPQIELVAAQYPGRRERIAEPPIDEMDRLAAELATALTATTARPYAFFGHSMGAAVAYETLLRLRRAGLPGPTRLFVSGREAPRHAHGGDVHRRDDAGLLAELARLGGTAPEVLTVPELQALVLPPVRADYRLIETYRPGPAEPLDVPVTAFVGDADPDVPADQATHWAETTTAGFDLQIFPGDHFYLTPLRLAVVAEIVRRLDSVAAWTSTP